MILSIVINNTFILGGELSFLKSVGIGKYYVFPHNFLDLRIRYHIRNPNKFWYRGTNPKAL
jgi:hypothetical protein